MKSKLLYLPAVAAAIFTTAVFLNAQNGSQGTITVADQTAAVVSGADLSLQNVSTNEVRKAATLSSGAYNFVGLNIGTYKLTVSRAGYASVVYDSVSVHAGLVTDINVTLKVGAISETVEVTAPAAPLVESTSSVVGSNIDLKLIENLPFGQDRDFTALAALVPGTAGGVYNPQIYGTPAVTWNGLPGAAQVTSTDGVIGQSSRFKDFGNAVPGSTATSPRIQNIEEMSVQTDQLVGSELESAKRVIGEALRTRPESVSSSTAASTPPLSGKVRCSSPAKSGATQNWFMQRRIARCAQVCKVESRGPQC